VNLSSEDRKYCIGQDGRGAAVARSKASEDERRGKNEVAWESAGDVGSTARS